MWRAGRGFIIDLYASVRLLVGVRQQATRVVVLCWGPTPHSLAFSAFTTYHAQPFFLSPLQSILVHLFFILVGHCDAIAFYWSIHILL